VPESNSSTEPGFVVARLGRPHGLNGFLGLYVEEADAVHFEPASNVSIDDRDFTVRAVRRVERGFQVQFEGVESREDAERIRGLEVTVSERRSLGEGEFWPDDLVGLEVRNGARGKIGTVIEFVAGGAQDRLAIEVDSGRYEIPFVTAFVPVVDLDGGYIEIMPIPGLIEPIV
jgi:16S rRNA processing protein RimM